MAITPLGFQVGPDRITAGINPYLDSAADIDRAIEDCPMCAISLLDGSDESPAVRGDGGRSPAQGLG